MFPVYPLHNNKKWIEFDFKTILFMFLKVTQI
jgi:hypothetical protein